MHSRSLIRSFTGLYLKSQGCKVSSWGHWRLWSDLRMHMDAHGCTCVMVRFIILWLNILRYEFEEQGWWYPKNQNWVKLILSMHWLTFETLHLNTYQQLLGCQNNLKGEWLGIYGTIQKQKLIYSVRLSLFMKVNEDMTYSSRTPPFQHNTRETLFPDDAMYIRYPKLPKKLMISALYWSKVKFYGLQTSTEWHLLQK